MKRYLLLAVLAVCGVSVDAAEAPLLINGTIVAPSGVIAGGWVAVEGGKITTVSATRPNLPGARVLVTKDMVFPGFVDLHNHPLYGIFPRWKPGKTFASRYQWRGDPAYHAAIQTPEGKLVTKNFCEMDAYVEIQALAGGTTSILGTYSPADTPTVPNCITGLARNLDWASGFHGTGVGNEPITNVLGVRQFDFETLSPQAVAMQKTGAYDLFAVHLGEGRRDDPDSQGEFAKLKELKLLGPKTAVIHGVALSEANFGELKTAGAAFIWSPRSNFELYGQTADIPAAVRSGVTMGLAPDWAPTGSMNMLAEIVYARTVSDRDFAGLVTAKQLFEMATIVPARIAKIDDKVGSLAPGLYADLFLLRGTSDPYDALSKAKPQDVTLTMVNGVPVYGSATNLSALGAEPEAVRICGEARAVSRQALPAGGFAEVVKRLRAALTAEKLTLADVAECR